MSGTNFADTIVVGSTERTTHTVKEYLKSTDWTGENFKRSQEEKMGKINGMRIQSAKITSKIEIGKMYKTTVPKLEGRYISINIGTWLQKL